MDKARYIDPWGNTKTVQIPKLGNPLEAGAEWYGGQGKYHALFCAHCAADVHYNGGSQSIAGSSLKGQSAYFATNPSSSHTDDCAWDLKKRAASAPVIDRTKGYRIHINTQEYSDLFNNASGVYARDEAGVVVTRDADMKDRERVVVHGVRDFIRFLETADPARVAQSRVVYRNNVVDWDDFFFRYGKPRRYFGLAKDLSAGSKTAEPRFGLFEIRTDKMYYIKGHKAFDIASDEIPTSVMDEDNRMVSIRPVVKIPALRDKVFPQFEGGAGHFLVLGQVFLNRFEGDLKTIDYLNIRVTQPEQIEQANIENIFETARQNAQKRAKKAPIPAP